jgi:ribosomal protein L19
MKLNLISPALAAIVGLAIASAPLTASAQSTNAAPMSTSTTGTTAAVAPKAKEKSKSSYTAYSGTLSALDATSVTVTTKKGDLKLMVDSTTMVQVDKKKAEFSSFAVGDKVTGSYATGADGTMTAHSLRKKSTK